MQDLDLVFLDNHLLVVNKPAGLLIQGDKTGDTTLFQIAKHYLKKAFNKPGNVYLGLVHRLDKPVSGLVVFARTSKAAARLSEQLREKTMKKTYRALVKGKTPDSGILEDYIIRNGSTSQIADRKVGKQAILTYRRLVFQNGISLLEIDLQTGRHHQIRVQLANLGFPILGDFKYGSKESFPINSIALHACSLRLHHPVKLDERIFIAAPAIRWPIY
jgi:23S rRNA pseudouridine1911/1915/1917 synthase